MKTNKQLIRSFDHVASIIEHVDHVDTSTYRTRVKRKNFSFVVERHALRCVCVVDNIATSDLSYALMRSFDLFVLSLCCHDVDFVRIETSIDERGDGDRCENIIVHRCVLHRDETHV